MRSVSNTLSTQTEPKFCFIEHWFKLKLKFEYFIYESHDEPASFIYILAIKTEHPVQISKMNLRELRRRAAQSVRLISTRNVQLTYNGTSLKP